MLSVMARSLAAVAALVIAGLVAPAPASARFEGPWCMHMTVGPGSVISRCDMRSYEMCRAEMGGLGGSYCTQNPYYRPMPQERQRQPRRSRAYRE